MGRKVCEIRQGHYYLVWFCVGFISGIFLWLVLPCLENIPFSVSWGYSLIFLIIMAVLMLAVPCLTQKTLTPFADRVLLLVILTGFIAGIFRINYEDNIRHRAFEDTFGTEHTYTGYVISRPTPSSTGKTNGIALNINRADGGRKLSGKVYLYIESEADINRGDIIEFTTTLSKPADASFVGGYSQRNSLYKMGYRASGYVSHIKKTGEKFEGLNLSYWLHTIGLTVQNGVLNTLEEYIGDNQEEYALLKGIIFGNKEDFSAEQYSKFADSGFIHITAASGLHVSFLCGFLFFMLKKLGFKRKISYLLTVPVIFIFAAAAEFTPSINRAVIMSGIYILGCLIQRGSHSLTSLAAAGVILLCINPYTVTDYGFILSFGSVSGIILFSPIMWRRIKRRLPHEYRYKKIIDAVIEPTCISLSSNLGIGYFLAKFFNRFSWGGIIGNLIVIPLGAFSFICGIVVWMLSFAVPVFAEIIAKYPLRYALYVMNKTADFFAFPLFNVYMPTPPYSFFPIYVMACWAIYFCLTHKTLTLNGK